MLRGDSLVGQHAASRSMPHQGAYLREQLNRLKRLILLLEVRLHFRSTRAWRNSRGSGIAREAPETTRLMNANECTETAETALTNSMIFLCSSSIALFCVPPLHTRHPLLLRRGRGNGLHVPGRHCDRLSRSFERSTRRSTPVAGSAYARWLGLGGPPATEQGHRPGTGGSACTVRGGRAPSGQASRPLGFEPCTST